MQDDPRFTHHALPFDKKLELFKEFTKELFNKKRQAFRDLLDENRAFINPFSEYANVEEMLKDDKRFQEFPERNRR